MTIINAGKLSYKISNKTIVFKVYSLNTHIVLLGGRVGQGHMKHTESAGAFH